MSIVNSTMRFGQDIFSFQPRGLLTSKSPIDTADQSSINGFVIEGSAPSGSLRKAIFKIEDKYYYFPTITSDGEAVAVEFPHEANLDNILDFGTSLSDLATISSIPNWTGLKIYPVIALQAQNSDTASIPTAKLGLKMTAISDQISKTEETSVYELTQNIGEKATIIDVTAKTTTTGSAAISIRAFLRNEDDWSSEYQLSELKNLDADAIKFRITYTVSELNAEMAKVDQIQVRYSSGGSGAVAGSEAEIVTIEQNYESGLRFVQATLKHTKLIDSNIDAFVSFRKQPLTRNLITIGTGTGEAHTYDLKPADQDDVDTKIDQSTLRIFIDGVEKTGFNFNSGTSQITITAQSNSVITASYQYELEEEIWRQMTLTSIEPYKQTGLYASRFEYTMPDDEDSKPIACVKFILERPIGDVVNESLGTATGLTQTFVLPHRAKIETISIPNCEFSYDEDSQMLNVVGARGTQINLSYSWVAESQEIDGFNIGFAAI